jgi:zinc transporter ZupT
LKAVASGSSCTSDFAQGALDAMLAVHQHCMLVASSQKFGPQSKREAMQNIKEALREKLIAR